MQSFPLRHYLATHEQSGQPIVLLSVDAKGADLQVPRSLDWEAQGVGAILVEIGKLAWAVAGHPTSHFPADKGLSPVLKFLSSELHFSKRSPSLSYTHG